MAFNRQDLQVAFSVPGTCEFTVWGYGTTDSLAEILQPDYLESAGRLVALGDLIYVHTWPRRDPYDGREIGERRAALAWSVEWSATTPRFGWSRTSVGRMTATSTLPRPSRSSAAADVRRAGERQGSYD